MGCASQPFSEIVRRDRAVFCAVPPPKADTGAGVTLAQSRNFYLVSQPPCLIFRAGLRTLVQTCLRFSTGIPYMAKIAPFAGLRYDPALAGDMSKVTSQPYDKIDRKLQADYYARHPYNIVRIILSDEANRDKETAYPEAAQTLKTWIEKGILKTDSQPAIYVYYQYFKFRGQTYTRKGFIASVELEEKGVRAHEHTLAGPKA